MRRALIIVGLAVWAAVAVAAPGSALSKRALRGSRAWQRFVLDRGDVVYPASVTVIGDPAAVENPNALRAEDGTPTTIHATGAGTPRLLLDLGINTGGWVEVGVRDSDGTPIRLGYAEARQFLTPSGDNPSHSLGTTDDPEGRTDVITTSGPLAWRSPGVRGAERWIALQLDGAGSATVDYVRVHTTHLPAAVADFAGHFLSSDPQLDRTWYAAAYTIALDSFADVRPGHQSPVMVVDGAKRDRLVWLGDLGIEGAAALYALRDAPAVIRSSLALFSCQQLPDGRIVMASDFDVVCPDVPPAPAPSASPLSLVGLAEYTAWWVVALHDYALATGDDAFATAMLPVVRHALDYFAAGLADGVFVTRDEPGTFATINWHPFDTAQGADAHTNAVWFRALKDAAALERRLGDGDAAADAIETRAVQLGAAMRAHLWDDVAGAFVVNAADPRPNHTQDAQVEAIFGGVLDDTDAQRALRFIDQHLATTYGVRNSELDDDPYMSNYISPYISSTELLARFQRGDTVGALALLRRLWGRMVDTDPQSTLWEKMSFAGEPANYDPMQAPVDPFGPNGAGLTSLAHGWATGPVPALSGYVLGIRPLAPGYRTWLVAPQPGDLRFADGEVPTPYGAIVSRWRRSPRDRWFKLTAGGPAGTTGQVAVPLLGHPRTIAMDGDVAWDGAAVGGVQATRDGDTVRFDAIAGVHTFAWSAAGR